MAKGNDDELQQSGEQPATSRPEWEGWDDQQKAKADEAIRLMDAIMAYRSGGGMGANAQYAPHSALLEAQGGVAPETATTLARYRMWKEITGGDPGWQGPTIIPTGTPKPPQSREDVLNRSKEFFATDPRSVERHDIVAEDDIRKNQTLERFYDSLVKKAPTPTPTPAPEVEMPPMAIEGATVRPPVYVKGKAKSRISKDASHDHKLMDAHLMLLEQLGGAGAPSGPNEHRK